MCGSPWQSQEQLGKVQHNTTPPLTSTLSPVLCLLQTIKPSCSTHWMAVYQTHSSMQLPWKPRRDTAWPTLASLWQGTVHSVHTVQQALQQCLTKYTPYHPLNRYSSARMRRAAREADRSNPKGTQVTPVHTRVRIRCIGSTLLRVVGYRKGWTPSRETRKVYRVAGE